MSGLRFDDLGFSAQSGKVGFDQAVQFRQQMRKTLPFIDGAYLTLVRDGERYGMKVAYDSGNEQAVSWAKRAEDLSAELWTKLEERRMERAR